MAPVPLAGVSGKEQAEKKTSRVPGGTRVQEPPAVVAALLQPAQVTVPQLVELTVPHSWLESASAVEWRPLAVSPSLPCRPRA